jgi:hypothetical protein
VVGRLTAQRAQGPSALDDPFVGVEHEIPVGAAVRQGGVAGGGEVVDPVEAFDAGAGASGDVGGRVDRAGVEHQHLVDARARAREAALEAARLVADDHHQRQSVHAEDGNMPTPLAKDRSGLEQPRLSTDFTHCRRIQRPQRFGLKFERRCSITLPTHLGNRVRGPVSRPKVGQHELPDNG